jgi:hypothetical protein
MLVYDLSIMMKPQTESAPFRAYRRSGRAKGSNIYTLDRLHQEEEAWPLIKFYLELQRSP